MNCTVCQSSSPAGARFCNRCGTALPAAATPAAASPAPARPLQAAAAASQPVSATGPAFAYAASAGSGVAIAPAAAAVDVASGLLARILAVTLRPKTEWPVIAGEPPALGRVVVGCVLPLAALSALLSFVHMALIGVSVPFAGSVRMPMAESLTAAVAGLVLSLAAFFVFALIVNAWAPVFSGQRRFGEALKVAAYAGVPAWIGSLFVVLPLGTLIGFLAAIYAVYVLYLGLPVVMRTPREKALGYTATVIVSGIVLGLVIGGVGAASGGFQRFRMARPSAEEHLDRGAATTGNLLGSLLGTDDQGKAALGSAIGNLARIGAQAQADSTAPAAPAPAAPTLPNAPATAGTAAVAATAPADPAAAGAALGNLLGALGGALGGSQRVTPVDFRTLGTMLPASLAGLPRGPVEGANKEALGVHASSASASYRSGARALHLKIADVSGVSGLLGIAGQLEQTTDAQTAGGFERDVMLGGRKVHEKFVSAGQHGELQVIVAQRFAVDLDGDGVDIATLERALGQVDLAQLESMKGAGAQR